MRKIILGKSTLYGESAIAANLRETAKVKGGASVRRMPIFRSRKGKAETAKRKKNPSRVAPEGASGPAKSPPPSPPDYDDEPLQVRVEREPASGSNSAQNSARRVTFGSAAPVAEKRPPSPSKFSPRSVANRVMGIPATDSKSAANGVPVKNVMAVSAVPRNADSSVLTKGLNLSHEQNQQMSDELSLSNLNYRHLEHRTMKRNWKYFTAVVLFQLFAVFSPAALFEAQMLKACNVTSEFEPFVNLGDRHGWRAHGYNQSVVMQTVSYIREAQDSFRAEA